MGQYFRAVNMDKREYVDPWHIGGGAKLWEWCVNTQAGIFPFLLRRSSEGGGGDIEEEYTTAGRWAGDHVVLVGDYDESGLWQEAERSFSNISQQLVQEYNQFIAIPDGVT
ncbi:MAG: hypothetical protein A2666_00495 [Parcubacteria group bacterium RIFCSPHIGHO2_01_FULL_47_10b]|nr:MAG: hypothetical protein A2666_00495 [Parcubacteria group bacterium RIFCSPHIGHO2_01_FULL_47_10b]